MAKRKIDAGTRVILATAAVVLGLAVGIVVVAIVNSGGGNGDEPVAYQPFFAGQSDRIMKEIKKDGPICYQDPKAGERSFCLDLVADQFVAYHVLPPGGTADCLVQWDRTEKHYENKCSGAPVEPATLARFPVLTKEISGKISVFVDVRTATPPA